MLHLIDRASKTPRAKANGVDSCWPHERPSLHLAARLHSDFKDTFDELLPLVRYLESADISCMGWYASSTMSKTRGN